MASVIFDPPAAPNPRTKSPFSSVITVGHIDDNGRLPGAIKLAGDGRIAKALIVPGVEKSSISLLTMIPVLGDMKPHPKLKVGNSVSS